MSNQTVGTNNGVQLFVNTDLSRVFLWENRYSKGSLNNHNYDPLVMRAGTLLGRILGTQTLWPCSSDNNDGSQIPVGILAEDITIADGVTAEVAFCNYGDVAEEKVILHPGDTLNTPIEGRSIRDRIGADACGIRLVAGTEMTDTDNA